MIGFINVNKRSGVSSAYVVYRIKKLLKVRCGHMGTLDPLAQGVLPVALGQATRLFDFLLDKEKTYLAEFDFSFTTPSLDLETEESARSPFIPSREEIESVLSSLVGEVEQIPPAYSAKFVDGKRSYKLARKGVEADLPPKKVTISSITMGEQVGDARYVFTINCSGGTYIRSIVRDIAKSLGVCGVMTKLTRTRSGFFTIDNAVPIDDLTEETDLNKFVIKPQDVIDLPDLVLEKSAAKRLIDGLKDEFAFADGLYKVYNEDEFWGIGEVDGGVIKMKAFIRDI